MEVLSFNHENVDSLEVEDESINENSNEEVEDESLSDEFMEDDEEEEFLTLQEALTKLDKNNGKLKYVHIFDQNITDSNIEDLVGKLKEYKILESLDLSTNQITDVGAKLIAEYLCTNHSLFDMSLTENKIGQDGARALAKSLTINSTFDSLDISKNKIGIYGAKAFSECLMNNSGLGFLDIRGNQIGNEGAIELAMSLRINNTLDMLCLSDNQIGDKGAQEFAKTVFVNKALKNLYLDNNTIDYEGGLALMDSHRRNTIMEELLVFDDKDNRYNDIKTELYKIGRWNFKWNHFHREDLTFPWSYKDHLLLLLMILNERPISHDLHWWILTMLKVDDITPKENFEVKLNWKPHSEMENDWSDELDIIFSTREESENKGCSHEEL